MCSSTMVIKSTVKAMTTSYNRFWFPLRIYRLLRAYGHQAYPAVQGLRVYDRHATRKASAWRDLWQCHVPTVSLLLTWELLDHGETLESRGSRKAQSRDGSQQRLMPANSVSYRFARYVPRAVLNISGPVILTIFYLFIVVVYLRRPAVNDIVPAYPINAKVMFFAWLVLSIFILDWAKSAIAGYEASALMKPDLAPSNAMQLMWHADRGWGSLTGWWKATVAVYSFIRHRLLNGDKSYGWEGPSPLWWYLAFSSFLLYAAIPLASLSMNPGDAFKLDSRYIAILGTNQTTFDIRSSNAIAESVSGRWRQGSPTTPNGEAIFYAPAGTTDVSNTYFEDRIQAIYNGTDNVPRSSSSPIKFFSGPTVAESAHGKAWGIETSLTCSVVHPYKDLDLLEVKSINEWTSKGGLSSVNYGPNLTTANDYLQFSGNLPVLFFVDETFGVSYQYLMATTGEIYYGGGGYIDASTLPLNSALELVMWQSYQSPYSPDAAFANLRSDPSVVSSFSPITNSTYLGYGIQCNITTDVGSANLDAKSRTYSAFETEPALVAMMGNTPSLTAYPGISGIDAIVFAAFTTVSIGYLGSPVCMPIGPIMIDQAVTCSPWYGANVATGGVPIFFEEVTSGPRAGDLRYPTISPKRMQLAIYKLFGEAAIALMASGPGPWVGNLRGLTPTSDLVPGKVPWIIVVVLFVIWCLVTVLPSCWTVAERRWTSTLDGFEMFRLGAEWREAVWGFKGNEIGENLVLAEVPGMVGDMEPKGDRGFVGLSRVVARTKGRDYTYDRALVGQ